MDDAPWFRRSNRFNAVMYCSGHLSKLTLNVNLLIRDLTTCHRHGAVLFLNAHIV